MITQKQLDEAVAEAYNHAHACCHYGPTDAALGSSAVYLQIGG